MPTTNAEVVLWGKRIGAVTWLEDHEVAVFQYTPDFVRSGIEISPLMMPLRGSPYEFPSLSKDTFKGLPGLLVDSLPDRFGNAIIDEWLASQGRASESFNPVERLCYTGKRGMGALEYEPSDVGPAARSRPLEVDKLVDLAARILGERANLGGAFSGEDDQECVKDILKVGTSAGGARAKAIIAWNPKTHEIRSGQVDLEKGFEHWIMKFDGVMNNGDRGLSDPLGYGKIEYTYYLMALASGIKMSDCVLHREGGRSHFMTRRFDRTPDGGKIHMLSLGAIAHLDFNQFASNSYEQAILTMKRLQMYREDLIQQVLRTIFNVVGRNHDDHVKNIAFLMDRSGKWRLSPAFDMTYAWNPSGSWTNRHQMSVNGKREEIDRDDLIKFGKLAGLKKKKCNDLINMVIDAFDQWPELAEKNELSEDRIDEIGRNLLTDI
ncbi:MAG: type II toxin-antitoxin system HipA family toxin [Candidatus Thermoplasmatota archaeon]|nr:type II toxin-antitoxin system HipA family toxin [Candidatus Thermoplasmatota archaeon]